MNLFGYSAKLVYDPERVEFTGSAASDFAGTVWEDAESLQMSVNASAGEVVMGVVREAGGENDKPPIGPFDNALFAVLHFEALACTGTAVFALDDTSPDNNILVVEEPEPAGVEALVAGGVTALVAAATFVRGDANGTAPIDPGDPEAAVNLADALFLLALLYQQGPAPPCLEAADANADGRINIVDAIAILQLLFLNPLVPDLPAPWPGLGRAPLSVFGCLAPPASGCQP